MVNSRSELCIASVTRESERIFDKTVSLTKWMVCVSFFVSDGIPGLITGRSNPLTAKLISVTNNFTPLGTYHGGTPMVWTVTSKVMNPSMHSSGPLNYFDSYSPFIDPTGSKHSHQNYNFTYIGLCMCCSERPCSCTILKRGPLPNSVMADIYFRLTNTTSYLLFHAPKCRFEPQYSVWTNEWKANKLNIDIWQFPVHSRIPGWEPLFKAFATPFKITLYGLKIRVFLYMTWGLRQSTTWLLTFVFIGLPHLTPPSLQSDWYIFEM